MPCGKTSVWDLNRMKIALQHHAKKPSRKEKSLVLLFTRFSCPPNSECFRYWGCSFNRIQSPHTDSLLSVFGALALVLRAVPVSARNGSPMVWGCNYATWYLTSLPNLALLPCPDCHKTSKSPGHCLALWFLWNKVAFWHQALHSQ